MKINDISNSFAIDKYTGSKNVKKDVRAVENDQYDRLELNDTARIFSEAVKAAKAAGDYSEEKVKEITEKLRQGTYDIKSAQIAEKMLGRRPERG